MLRVLASLLLAVLAQNFAPDIDSEADAAAWNADRVQDLKDGAFQGPNFCKQTVDRLHSSG